MMIHTLSNLSAQLNEAQVNQQVVKKKQLSVLCTWATSKLLPPTDECWEAISLKKSSLLLLFAIYLVTNCHCYKYGDHFFSSVFFYQVIMRVLENSHSSNTECISFVFDFNYGLKFCSY